MKAEHTLYRKDYKKSCSGITFLPLLVWCPLKAETPYWFLIANVKRHWYTGSSTGRGIVLVSMPYSEKEISKRK